MIFVHLFPFTQQPKDMESESSRSSGARAVVVPFLSRDAEGALKSMEAARDGGDGRDFS